MKEVNNYMNSNMNKCKILLYPESQLYTASSIIPNNRVFLIAWGDLSEGRL